MKTVAVNEIDPELVSRHLRGLTSAEEEARLRRWMEADPTREESMRSFREAWAIAGILADEHDSAAAWNRVAGRLQLSRPIAQQPRRQSKRSTVQPRQRSSHPAVAPLLRRAAVFVLLAGGALWPAIRGVLSLAPETRTYATAVAKRATIRLSDDSRAVLGPESELRYPARFTRGNREVELVGMGYFDVATDPDRPFFVHASGVTARVLGTRFVVRAYPGDADVAVAVAEGSVAVAADSAPGSDAVVLRRGQLGEVDAEGVARVVESASTDELLGWTEGRFVFRDVPLRDVSRDLERWYGVEIRIAEPSLAARRITLSFPRAPLGEILEVIVVALDARFERNGTSIILRPRSTPRDVRSPAASGRSAPEGP